MAIMNPRVLHNPTQGEEDLYNFFSKSLPDTTYVYYEKNVQELRADFIIVDQYIGVMVVEVKDWGLDFFNKSIDLTKEEFHFFDKKIRNPNEQASIYRRNLYGHLSNLAINHKANYYNKRLYYPVNHLVAFPNLLRSEFESIFNDGKDINTIMDPDLILFKDHFLYIQNSVEPQSDFVEILMEKRIHKFLKGHDRIDPVDYKYINSAINPRIIINDSPDNVFKALEQKQIHECSFIPSSDRIIRGIAGSGKTIMLLKQIEYIVDELPDASILLINYTKTLRAEFRKKFENFKNVHVYGYSELNNIKDYKYDFIFIDESQDLKQKYIKAANNLRNEGNYGYITLCTDWGQSIYTHTVAEDYSEYDYSFGQLGLDIHSNNIIELTMNYRNTLQVARFAHNFLHDSTERIPSGNDPMHNTYLTEMKSALRIGDSYPVIEDHKSHNDAIKSITDHIVKLLADGVNPNDILLMVQSKSGIAEQQITELRNELNANHISYIDYIKDYTRDTLMIDGQIRLSTIHSAKGLEAKYTFLYANEPLGASPEVNRKALYVGLTRSTSFLTVFTNDPESDIAINLSNSLKLTKDEIKNSELDDTEYKKLNSEFSKYHAAFKQIMNLTNLIHGKNAETYICQIKNTCKRMGISDINDPDHGPNPFQSSLYNEHINPASKDNEHLYKQIIQLKEQLKSANRQIDEKNTLARNHYTELLKADLEVNNLKDELQRVTATLKERESSQAIMESQLTAKIDKAKFQIRNLESKNADLLQHNEELIRLNKTHKSIFSNRSSHLSKIKRYKTLIAAIVSIIVIFAGLELADTSLLRIGEALKTPVKNTSTETNTNALIKDKTMPKVNVFDQDRAEHSKVLYTNTNIDNSKTLGINIPTTQEVVTSKFFSKGKANMSNFTKVELTRSTDDDPSKIDKIELLEFTPKEKSVLTVIKQGSKNYLVLTQKGNLYKNKPYVLPLDSDVNQLYITFGNSYAMYSENGQDEFYKVQDLKKIPSKHGNDYLLKVNID